MRALCLEVEDALEAGLSDECQCEVEAGLYPSVAACFAEKGLIAGAGQCRCDIYAEVPEMGPYLECLKPMATEFSECFATLGCDGFCFLALIDADACQPVKSAEAESEFECAGAEPFLCGSGEEIPDTWLCDFDFDCEDLSDESECVFVCKSGDEIPEDWQCDGFEDCPDGDDEEGCDP